MRKQVQGLIFVVIVSLTYGFSAAATYGGGSGTPVDPYQIWTPEQMNTIGLNPADWSLHFKLMADIDMSAYTGTQYNIIGNSTTKFTGTFEGNNHIIRNLAVTDGTQYTGLFGYTYISTIQNLTLENAAIYGVSYTGALVGYHDGTISNCYVSGSVQGGSLTGGLAGRNNGTITDCQSNCTVSSSDFHIGGLVGRNNGTITGCEFNGDVTGDTNVGGIVGQNYGDIIECSAIGSIQGRLYVGGLAGQNDRSLIKSCYSAGTVSWYRALGGLVGYNMGSIIDSYSTADVSGYTEVGGLVGYYNSSYTIMVITNCYAAGLVKGGLTYEGGLIGFLYSGAVNSCFWNTETCGTATGIGWPNPDPPGVIGRTTAQMMTLATFTGAGWDFSSGDGDAADWMMLRPGEDYPRLAWQTVLAGDIAGLYGVDIVDFLEIAENWLEEGCPIGCEQADINSSGKVDLADFAVVASQWLKEN